MNAQGEAMQDQISVLQAQLLRSEQLRDAAEAERHAAELQAVHAHQAQTQSSSHSLEGLHAKQQDVERTAEQTATAVSSLEPKLVALQQKSLSVVGKTGEIESTVVERFAQADAIVAAATKENSALKADLEEAMQQLERYRRLHMDADASAIKAYEENGRLKRVIEKAALAPKAATASVPRSPSSPAIDETKQPDQFELFDALMREDGAERGVLLAAELDQALSMSMSIYGNNCLITSILLPQALSKSREQEGRFEAASRGLKESEIRLGAVEEKAERESAEVVVVKAEAAEAEEGKTMKEEEVTRLEAALAKEQGHLQSLLRMDGDERAASLAADLSTAQGRLRELENDRDSLGRQLETAKKKGVALELSAERASAKVALVEKDIQQERVQQLEAALSQQAEKQPSVKRVLKAGEALLRENDLAPQKELYEASQKLHAAQQEAALAELSCERTKSKAAAFETEVGRLQGICAITEGELARLQAELAKQATDTAALMRMNGEEVGATLVIQLQEATVKGLALETDLAEASNQLAEHKKQRAVAEASAERAKSTIGVIEQELRDAEQARVGKEKEVARLVAGVAQQEELMSALVGEEGGEKGAFLAKMLQDANKTTRELGNRLAEAEAAMDQAHSGRKKAEIAAERASAKLAAVELNAGEVASLAETRIEEVKRLHAALTKKEQDVVQLMNMDGDKRGALVAAELADTRGKVLDLEARLNQADKSNAASKAEAAKAAVKLEALATILANAEQEAPQRDAEVARLEAALAQKSDNLIQLMKQDSGARGATVAAELHHKSEQLLQKEKELREVVQNLSASEKQRRVEKVSAEREMARTGALHTDKLEGMLKQGGDYRTAALAKELGVSVVMVQERDAKLVSAAQALQESQAQCRDVEARLKQLQIDHDAELSQQAEETSRLMSLNGDHRGAVMTAELADVTAASKELQHQLTATQRQHAAAKAAKEVALASVAVMEAEAKELYNKDADERATHIAGELQEARRLIAALQIKVKEMEAPDVNLGVPVGKTGELARQGDKTGGNEELEKTTGLEMKANLKHLEDALQQEKHARFMAEASVQRAEEKAEAKQAEQSQAFHAKNRKEEENRRLETALAKKHLEVDALMKLDGDQRGAALAGELHKASGKVSALENQLAQVQTELARTKTEHRGLEAAVERASATVHDAESDKAAHREDSRLKEGEIQRLKAVLQEKDDEVGKLMRMDGDERGIMLASNLAEASEKVLQLESTCEELASQLKEAKQERGKAEAATERAQAKATTLSAEVTKADKASKAREDVVNRLESTVMKKTDTISTLAAKDGDEKAILVAKELAESEQKVLHELEARLEKAMSEAEDVRAEHGVVEAMAGRAAARVEAVEVELRDTKAALGNQGLEVERAAKALEKKSKHVEALAKMDGDGRGAALAAELHDVQSRVLDLETKLHKATQEGKETTKKLMMAEATSERAAAKVVIMEAEVGQAADACKKKEDQVSRLAAALGDKTEKSSELSLKKEKLNLQNQLDETAGKAERAEKQRLAAESRAHAAGVKAAAMVGEIEELSEHRDLKESDIGLLKAALEKKGEDLEALIAMDGDARSAVVAQKLSKESAKALHLESKLTAVTQQLEKFQKRHAVAEAAAERASAKVEIMEAEHAVKRRQQSTEPLQPLEEAQQQRGVAEAAVERAEATAKALEFEVSEARETNRSHREQEARLEAALAKQGEHINALAESGGDERGVLLARQLGEVSDKLLQLEKDLRETKKEKAVAEAEAERANAKNEAMGMEISALEEKHGKNEDRAAFLGDSLDKKDAIVSELMKKNTGQRQEWVARQLEATFKTNDNLEAKVHELDQELQSSRKQAALADVMVKRALAKLEATEAEHAELRSGSRGKKEEIEHLEAALAKKAEHNEELMEMSGDVRSAVLAHELESSSDQIRFLEKKLQSLEQIQKQALSAEAAAERAAAKVTAIEVDEAKVVAAHESSQEEVARLMAALDNKAEQVQRMLEADSGERGAAVAAELYSASGKVLELERHLADAQKQRGVAAVAAEEACTKAVAIEIELAAQGDKKRKHADHADRLEIALAKTAGDLEVLMEKDSGERGRMMAQELHVALGRVLELESGWDEGQDLLLEAQRQEVKAKNDAEKTIAKAQVLEREVISLEADKLRLEEDLARHKAALADKFPDHTFERILALDNQLKHASREVNQAREELAAAEAQAERTTIQMETLQASVDEAATDLAAEKVAEVQATVKQTQRALQANEEEMDRLQGRVVELEATSGKKPEAVVAPTGPSPTTAQQAQRELLAAEAFAERAAEKVTAMELKLQKTRDASQGTVSRLEAALTRKEDQVHTLLHTAQDARAAQVISQLSQEANRGLALERKLDESRRELVDARRLQLESEALAKRSVEKASSLEADLAEAYREKEQLASALVKKAEAVADLMKVDEGQKGLVMATELESVSRQLRELQKEHSTTEEQRATAEAVAERSAARAQVYKSEMAGVEADKETLKASVARLEKELLGHAVDNMELKHLLNAGTQLYLAVVENYGPEPCNHGTLSMEPFVVANGGDAMTFSKLAQSKSGDVSLDAWIDFLRERHAETSLALDTEQAHKWLRGFLNKLRLGFADKPLPVSRTATAGSASGRPGSSELHMEVVGLKAELASASVKSREDSIEKEMMATKLQNCEIALEEVHTKLKEERDKAEAVSNQVSQLEGSLTEASRQRELLRHENDIAMMHKQAEVGLKEKHNEEAAEIHSKAVKRLQVEKEEVGIRVRALEVELYSAKQETVRREAAEAALVNKAATLEEANAKETRERLALMEGQVRLEAGIEEAASSRAEQEKKASSLQDELYQAKTLTGCRILTASALAIWKGASAMRVSFWRANMLEQRRGIQLAATREKMEASARGAALRQMKQFLARMLQGEIGMRLRIWKQQIIATSYQRHAAMRAALNNQVHSESLKSGLTAIRQAVNDVIKGQASTRVRSWHSKVMKWKERKELDRMRRECEIEAEEARRNVSISGMKRVMSRWLQDGSRWLIRAWYVAMLQDNWGHTLAATRTQRMDEMDSMQSQHQDHAAAAMKVRIELIQGYGMRQLRQVAWLMLNNTAGRRLSIWKEHAFQGTHNGEVERLRGVFQAQLRGRDQRMGLQFVTHMMLHWLKGRAGVRLHVWYTSMKEDAFNATTVAQEKRQAAAMIGQADEHHAAMSTNQEEHGAAMKSQEEEHEEAIRARHQEHEAALQGQDVNHATALKGKDEEHREALDSMAERHMEALEAMKERYIGDAGNAVQELEQQHAGEMQATQSTHQAACEAAQASHQEALKSLQEQHSLALEGHQDEITAKEQVYESALKAREDAHANELKKNEEYIAGKAEAHSIALKAKEDAHAVELKRKEDRVAAQEEGHSAALKANEDEWGRKSTEHSITLKAKEDEWGRKAEEHSIALKAKEDAHTSALKSAEAQLQAKHQDTHTALKTQLDSRTKELQSMQEAHASQIHSIQAQLKATEDNKTNELKSKAAELQTKEDAHENELQTKAAIHATELKAKQDVHASQLSLKQEAHANEIKTKADIHANEIKTREMELQGKEELHAGKLKMKEDELQAKQEEHARRVEDLASKHAVEQEARQDKHDELKKKHEAELEAMGSKHTEVRQKHLSELEALTDKHNHNLDTLSEKHSHALKAKEDTLETLAEKHNYALKAKEDAYEALRSYLTAATEQHQAKVETVGESAQVKIDFLQEAAAKHKREATYFEDKLKVVRDQKESLETRVSALSGQVAGLEQKLDAQTQRAKELECKCAADAEERTQEAHAQAGAHVDQLKMMKEALTREEENGRESQERLQAKHEASIDALHQKIGELNDRILALKTECHEHEGRHSVAAVREVQLIAESQGTTQQLVNMGHEVQRLQAAVAEACVAEEKEFEALLQEEKHSRTQAEEELKALEQTMQETQAACAAAKAMVLSTSESLEKSEQEVYELRRSVEELKDDHEFTIDKLKSDSKLRLQHAEAAKEERIRLLDAEMDRHKRSLAGVQQLNKEWESAAMQAGGEQRELIKVLEAVRLESDEKSTMMDELEAELLRKHSELEVLSSLQVDLTHTIEKSRQELTKTKTQAEQDQEAVCHVHINELATMQTSLSELTSRAEVACSDAERRAKVAEEAVWEKSLEIQKLQMQGEERQGQYERLRTETDERILATKTECERAKTECDREMAADKAERERESAAMHADMILQRKSLHGDIDRINSEHDKTVMSLEAKMERIQSDAERAQAVSQKEHEADVTMLRAEKEVAAAEHDKQIALLQQDEATQVAIIRAELGQQVSLLQSQLELVIKEEEKKLLELQTTKDAQLTEMQTTKDAQLTEMQTTKDAQLTAYETDGNHKLATLKADFETRLQQYEAGEAVLTAKIRGEFEQQLASVRLDLQQASTDYEKQLATLRHTMGQAEAEASRKLDVTRKASHLLEEKLVDYAEDLDRTRKSLELAKNRLQEAQNFEETCLQEAKKKRQELEEEEETKLNAAKKRLREVEDQDEIRLHDAQKALREVEAGYEAKLATAAKEIREIEMDRDGKLDAVRLETAKSLHETQSKAARVLDEAKVDAAKALAESNAQGEARLKGAVQKHKLKAGQQRMRWILRDIITDKVSSMLAAWSKGVRESSERLRTQALQSQLHGKQGSTTEQAPAPTVEVSTPATPMWTPPREVAPPREETDINTSPLKYGMSHLARTALMSHLISTGEFQQALELMQNMEVQLMETRQELTAMEARADQTVMQAKSNEKEAELRLVLKADALEIKASEIETLKLALSSQSLDGRGLADRITRLEAALAKKGDDLLRLMEAKHDEQATMVASEWDKTLAKMIGLQNQLDAANRAFTEANFKYKAAQEKLEGQEDLVATRDATITELEATARTLSQDVPTKVLELERLEKERLQLESELHEAPNPDPNPDPNPNPRISTPRGEQSQRCLANTKGGTG